MSIRWKNSWRHVFGLTFAVLWIGAMGLVFAEEGAEPIDKPQSALIDATLNSPESPNDARDPLADVADILRPKLDPTLGEQWPDYNPDFVEVIGEIHHEYDRFWERISPHTRWFVDLDNDGKNECVVLSQGLNDSAWGFSHFVAVLKPPTWPKEPSDPWELAYLYVFESAGGARPVV